MNPVCEKNRWRRGELRLWGVIFVYVRTISDMGHLTNVSLIKVSILAMQFLKISKKNHNRSSSLFFSREITSYDWWWRHIFGVANTKL